MKQPSTIRSVARGTGAAALLIAAAVSLSGCIGGVPTNRSLYSEKQPVVGRDNFVFDVATNGGGVPISERQRLLGWFEAMELDYGDRISIEYGNTGYAAREDLEALAESEGLLISDMAPVTQGSLAPGVARVVITRAHAYVPGCPDWSAKSDANPFNATRPGYGCAVNGNMAAMVADPEDLLRGQRGTGETVVMSSTKAIETFREQTPTGEGGLKSNSSQGN